MLVLPGFVDLHTHLRTPGREDEEDIATGSAAAAAGGYVAVFGMANTDPVVDTATVLKGLAETARAEAAIPVGFFAAVTRGLAGEQLTEMGELGAAGAVAFSDDGRPLATAALTRRALQYVKVSGRFVAIHAQDDSLFKGGQMHEGPVSARLGLTGIPSLCESLDVSRTLDIAEYEDAAVHVCHVSTEASLVAIARAKAAGVQGDGRGDAASPDAHRRGHRGARPQPQDEPAAARRERPQGARRGAQERARRLRRHRPRAARLGGEGRPVRGGAVRHHRARDRLRRPLRRSSSRARRSTSARW